MTACERTSDLGDRRDPSCCLIRTTLRDNVFVNSPAFGYGSTIAGLGCVPEQVGGVADHVHLLVGLRATHWLADVLNKPGIEYDPRDLD